ncbi:MAG: bifunctional heptose 7-phosphate kinase/heptose 1-phosphate adenyltransferase, partial [Silvanigrellaceae bacterium]|nr:bifunctional heptose 7-phosphate kinase/heptose 1-phosphate adenyltransferase [Silvanigrellaceae bacterium]
MHSAPQDVLLLKNAQIFIVGDIILDSYIEGKVSRISPEAPVPVLVESSRKNVPGGAGNVAANITSMGASVYLCGRVGDDFEANALLEVLKKRNINTSFLFHSCSVPTITKTRIVSGNNNSSGYQQIVRIDKEVIQLSTQDEENFIVNSFIKFLQEQKECRCLILSDYGKGLLSPPLIAKLISLCHQHNIPIITDPKSEDISRYQGSTVIKPNLSEGKAVLKSVSPGRHFQTFEQEVQAITDCYLKLSGAENIVMSLSEHGLIATGNQISKPLKLSSHALEVADVSGAGDTLVAFLACSLAVGLDLKRATEYGNLAAGLVCAKSGTATLTPGEFLEAFKLQSETTHPEKILARELLAPVFKDVQKIGRKVVFTNGCFDILHAGHVKYLQQAKALGDFLVVGLNSDESIKQLKGPSRPIQTFLDRAEILASLACVDFVVGFHELTPLNTILEVRPDILVKGADYNL